MAQRARLSSCCNRNQRFVSRPCVLTLWLKISLYFLPDLLYVCLTPCLSRWHLFCYSTFSGIVQEMYARFPSTVERDIFVGNGKLIFLYIWPQERCWSSTLSHTSAHLDSSLCHGLVMWVALFCRGMACSARLVLSCVMEGPSWTLTGPGEAVLRDQSSFISHVARASHHFFSTNLYNFISISYQY